MSILESDIAEPVGERLPDLEQFRLLRGYHRDRACLTVEREIRRLQGLQAAMVFEVDRSCSFLDDFHHSASAWFTAVTNSSKATAKWVTRTGALLELLPMLAAAVSEGRVGPDQVRLLARLHANDRCRPLLPDSEALLVGHAITLTWREFRQVCLRWEAWADPDGAHRDHEASRENRHVSSSQVGAGHVLHAEGDALTGDIIKEILDAHVEAEYQADLAQRSQQYGDQANKYPLRRTARQRRYDAFFTMCTKSAGTTESTDRVPLVNIFCTEAVLNQAIRQFFSPGNTDAGPEAASPVSERMRLCETASGAPVDPHDLVIAALIGQVRRVVVDTAGRVIDLGRRSRLFTGAAREAVLLGGDRCCHPGCEMRIRNIQIDHLDAWAASAGPTNPFNGGPRCPSHNRAKERGQFTVKRDATGWHHFRPDGTEIAPRN